MRRMPRSWHRSAQQRLSEFEREMIVARVNAGFARAKHAIAKDGKLLCKARMRVPAATKLHSRTFFSAGRPIFNSDMAPTAKNPTRLREAHLWDGAKPPEKLHDTRGFSRHLEVPGLHPDRPRRHHPTVGRQPRRPDRLFARRVHVDADPPTLRPDGLLRTVHDRG